MIGSITVIGIAFIWLGYETNWMRVRLLCGATSPKQHQTKLLYEAETTKQQARQWQFIKYGDDALMLCRNCSLWRGRNCCLYHHFSKNKTCWFGWKISSRVIKLYDSIINFKEGCNRQRANIIRKVIKLQKSKAKPTYHTNNRAACFPLPPGFWGKALEEPTLELFVDGNPVATINGKHKGGDIRKALESYTTKG